MLFRIENYLFSFKDLQYVLKSKDLLEISVSNQDDIININLSEKELTYNWNTLTTVGLFYQILPNTVINLYNLSSANYDSDKLTLNFDTKNHLTIYKEQLNTLNTDKTFDSILDEICRAI